MNRFVQRSGGGNNRLVWSGGCDLYGTGLRPLLDALLQRIDLIEFQAVELVGDAGVAHLLAVREEIFALEVQLLCQSEHPDLLILLFCVFGLRIRQAVLPLGCSEQPLKRPTSSVGILVRPIAPRTSYILIARLPLKRGLSGNSQ